jgi:hypothetical protein
MGSRAQFVKIIVMKIGNRGKDQLKTLYSTESKEKMIFDGKFNGEVVAYLEV